MAQLKSILVKPLITEKTADAGEKYNRYGFQVQLKANKNQIREAIEKLYDVKVLSVKTSVMPGKVKRAGMKHKKSAKKKKAFVELAEGQKIEFFKGV